MSLQGWRPSSPTWRGWASSSRRRDQRAGRQQAPERDPLSGEPIQQNLPRFDARTLILLERRGGDRRRLVSGPLERLEVLLRAASGRHEETVVVAIEIVEERGPGADRHRPELESPECD